jgi:predicted lipoprotein with Yx(FWY)xxD motif
VPRRLTLNYKALTSVLVVLTVIFAGATAYMVAYPAKSAQTFTSTVTVAGSASNAVGIAYKQGIGFYLVNGTGFTLYYRTSDKPNSGTTTCVSSTCEKNWPAFYRSSLVLATGLNASSFAVITPYNSTKIVTYGGYPLYYWTFDAKPGDTTGQGVGQFYVATVPALAATASTTTSTSDSTTTTTTIPTTATTTATTTTTTYISY